MRKKQLQFVPTPELRELLQREADRRATSVAAVIREALLNYYAPEIEKLRKQNEKASLRR